MAMISKRSNPINITPFVDVLLILFVILIVAARFDVEVPKPIEQPQPIVIDNQNDYKALEISLSDKEAKLKKLAEENQKLKNEINTTNKEQLQVKNSSLKSDDEIKKLKEENTKLTQENKKLSNLGIRIGINLQGNIYIKSPYDDELLYITRKQALQIIGAAETKEVKATIANSKEAKDTWAFIEDNIKNM